MEMPSGSPCWGISVHGAEPTVQAWYATHLEALGYIVDPNPVLGPYFHAYHITVPGQPDAVFMVAFVERTPHRTDVWASLYEWIPVSLAHVPAHP